MKKGITILLVMMLITKLTAQTINAIDFGLDNGQDATPVIYKALEKCQEIGAKKLIIPKGKYHFYRDKAYEKYCAISNNDNGLKRIAFPLIGFQDFEIDGQGSEFIFHGHMVPFVIENSKNLTLHNFSIDWDKQFHLQAEVVAVNAGSNSFDIKISEENDYEVIGDELMFYSNGILQNMQHNLWFDPKTKATVYKVDEYKIKTWDPKQREYYTAKDMGNRIVRITHTVAKLPEIGWTFIVKGKQPKDRVRLSPAISVYKSFNLDFFDINIYHAGGMGLIGERSGDISLDNFNVLLPPDSKRLVSTTADATHFVNCKGVIKMANCTFENMLDDATNIHGVYAKIFDIPDEQTIGAKISHFQQKGFDFAQPGDTLLFVDSETLSGYQQARVANVKVYNEEYMEIRLDRDVSDIAKSGDGIENISWSASAHVTKCTVRRNRARSMLFSTRGKVLVEDNYFSSMMAAIGTAGGLGYWCESGPAEDITIRNNTFVDCCTGNENQSVIYIKPKRKLNDQQIDYYHKNITIEGNEIRTFDRSIVSAFSIDGLTIKNNKIINSKTYPPRYPDKPTFDIKFCRNVSILSNEIKDDKKGNISFDKHTAGSITINNNKGFK